MSVAIGLVATSLVFLCDDGLIDFFCLEGCATWPESSSFHPEDGA